MNGSVDPGGIRELRPYPEKTRHQAENVQRGCPLDVCKQVSVMKQTVFRSSDFQENRKGYSSEIRKKNEPPRCPAGPPGAGYRLHGLRYVERYSSYGVERRVRSQVRGNVPPECHRSGVIAIGIATGTATEKPQGCTPAPELYLLPLLSDEKQTNFSTHLLASFVMRRY